VQSSRAPNSKRLALARSVAVSRAFWSLAFVSTDRRTEHSRRRSPGPLAAIGGGVLLLRGGRERDWKRERGRKKEGEDWRGKGRKGEGDARKGTGRGVRGLPPLFTFWLYEPVLRHVPMHHDDFLIARRRPSSELICNQKHSCRNRFWDKTFHVFSLCKKKEKQTISSCSLSA